MKWNPRICVLKSAVSPQLFVSKCSGGQQQSGGSFTAHSQDRTSPADINNIIPAGERKASTPDLLKLTIYTIACSFKGTFESNFLFGLDSTKCMQCLQRNFQLSTSTPRCSASPIMAASQKTGRYPWIHLLLFVWERGDVHLCLSIFPIRSSFTWR